MVKLLEIVGWKSNEQNAGKIDVVYWSSYKNFINYSNRTVTHDKFRYMNTETRYKYSVSQAVVARLLATCACTKATDYWDTLIYNSHLKVRL